jgi:hypothetical protein
VMTLGGAFRTRQINRVRKDAAYWTFIARISRPP